MQGLVNLLADKWWPDLPSESYPALKVSRRMYRTAGTFHVTSAGDVITLAELLIREGSYDDIYDTVLHELVHWALHQRGIHAPTPHGAVFRSEAHYVGLNGSRANPFGEGLRAKRVRYTYVCPTCNLKMERRRKGTWSCGKCSPLYDPKYQLVLVREERL